MRGNQDFKKIPYMSKEFYSKQSYAMMNYPSINLNGSEKSTTDRVGFEGGREKLINTACSKSIHPALFRN